MLPKLTFLTALVLLTAFLLAAHCPEGGPDCGHGGSCGCLNLPGFGGAPDSYCKGEPGDGRTATPIPGGGGGPGGGATPTPEPTPDIPWFQGVGGLYSYNGDCSDEIDPITVVVRRNGAAIVEHVSHHGVEDPLYSPPWAEPLDEDATSEFWGLHEGRQNYLDGGVCVLGEVSQATNDGWHWCGVWPVEYACAESRWHTRCNIVGSYHDPYGGATTFSVCTPHWDQADGTLPCWHWVPAEFGDRWDGDMVGGIRADISGFTAGRDYMLKLLFEGPGGSHRLMGSYFYGNNFEQGQCNGDRTASSGDVFFFEVLP